MSQIREIHTQEISSAIAELCIKANVYLPSSVKSSIQESIKNEKNPLCCDVLGDLVDNMQFAEQSGIPVCQDTGMAVVFLEIGQDVHIIGGSIEEAVNSGVAKGYTEGRLRMSVVLDPIKRINTNNNTPAVIHTKIVPGDKIHIMVAPKGFGSENMSAIKMSTPSATKEDIIDFIVSCVDKAGSNPCPPIVVGVGIGGDFELCAYLAKKALCRDKNQPNPDPFYAELEHEILDRINCLGIGAQGFGGTVTALYVNIEQYATHIAGLPVAVNMGCHVTRHAHAIL